MLASRILGLKTLFMLVERAGCWCWNGCQGRPVNAHGVNFEGVALTASASISLHSQFFVTIREAAGGYIYQSERVEVWER